MQKQFYVRRQTNAGPNQGKWTVHRPDGVSIVGGLEKKTAVLICAAFDVASTAVADHNNTTGQKHPSLKAPEDCMWFSDYWEAEAPRTDGRVFVQRKREG